VTDSLASQAGRALLWTGAGLLAGRLISFLRFLILARLLTPVDFGLLAIAWVAIEFLLTVTDVGMVTALVQREEVSERHYDTAWTIGLVRALLVAAVIVAGAPLIAGFFGEPRAAGILRVLALGPVLSAAASIKMAELTRHLEFGKLTMIRLPEAATEAAVSIALAPLLGVWALVAGVLVANLVRLALSYRLAPHWPRVSFSQGAARSLFSFGRWLFVLGILGLAGEALLRAAISRRLGTAELGLFYLAVRLAMLPFTSIEGMIASVGVPVHARLQTDPRRGTRALQTSLVGMLAVLIPGYAVLVVLAGSLVEEVLGPRWAGAAPVIRVLAVAAAIETMGAACTPMLFGLGRPRFVVGLATLKAVLLVAGAWVLTGVAGVVGAAVAWLIADAAAAVGWTVGAARIVVRPLPRLGVQLLAVLAGAAAAALTAFGIDRLLSGAGAVVAAAALAMGVAAAALWLLDRWLDAGLVDTLGRLFPAVSGRLARGRHSQ
jgi:O-antigen/teichoic acid export membrane protein